MAEDFDFSGTWRSSYSFTTESPDADFTDAYDVQLLRTGNQLVIESTPKEDGSYILLRLVIDGRVLTGTFYETTATKGHYKGVTYCGTLVLIMDPDGNALRGRWLGLDDNLKFQTGEQTITRISKEQA